MSRISIFSLVLSTLLHGGALVILAGLDFSPAGAPPVAGGRGSGILEVWIRPGGEAPPVPEVREKPEEMAPPEEPPLDPAPQDLSSPLPSPPEMEIPPPPEPSPKPPERAPVPPAEKAAGGEPGGPGTDGPAIEDPAALRPVYPMSCRRLRHEGTAVVRILIGEDGRPILVELSRSAGCEELDRAALDAVRRARFRPARSWGRPVTARVEQPIKFELRKIFVPPAPRP